MSELAAISTLLPLGALALRWWIRERSMGLEGIVLVASSWLTAMGLLGTALAVGGNFAPWPLAGGCLAIGALSIPWRELRRAPTSAAARLTTTTAQPPVRGVEALPTIALLLVVGLGALLRQPTIPASLAGRDQGTYALLAQQVVRTGSLAFEDPVLARGGRELGHRSGPADLLGLYERREDGVRAGEYEGAYRPGLYLADRDRGRVVPQFLHLHPSLLAVGAICWGARGIEAMVSLQAVLALFAFAAVARRLWPRGAWWGFAAFLAAVSPILVWTQRLPLSEGPMLLLGLSACLALLRARDAAGSATHEERRGWLFLGAMAWTRGNAWIVLPVVLMILWLRPRPHLGVKTVRNGPWPLWGLATASVLVHASTSFPYLHDELLRRLPNAVEMGPAAVVAVAIVACVAWVSLDLLIAHRSRAGSRAGASIAAELPAALLLLAACALAYYVASTAGASLGDRPPFGRLDAALPLLGLPLIGLGLAGAAMIGLRWRAQQEDVGVLAIMAIPALTLALYAGRGLPRLELYYYGRYLVPELVPALVLAAVAALRLVHGWANSRSQALATALSWTGAAGLAWSVGGILVTDPGTRFREQAEADRAVDWLSERLPADAIVLAGGEGWHFGHTHNQMGGALALGRGHEVLPYHSQEAAYASLWELLIAGPRARNEAPPRVFLLLNEASHNYLRDGGSPAAVTVAGIDDHLPAPFRIRSRGLLELFVHGLTAMRDRIPTRITRHELRMALLEVEVDPERMGELEQWELDGRESPNDHALVVRNAQQIAGGLCLADDTTTEILVPPSGAASERPAFMVLVAAPGSQRGNHRWRVEADGRPLAFDAVGVSPRERDTLGPVLLERRPRRITVRGDGLRQAGGRCPGGVLAQLRIIEATTGALAPPPPDWAISIAAADDYGFPYERSEWVEAKSINRFRPGTVPTPNIDHLAMRLAGGQALEFAPIFAPAGGEDEVDLVVTLTGTRTSSTSSLRVFADDRLLAEFDPPDEMDGSWTSRPVTCTLEDAILRIRAELHASDEDEWIGIRDIALFVRGTTISATSKLP